MTPDEARLLIAQGIVAFAEAIGEEVEMLGDWVLVFHDASLDGDRDESAYFRISSSAYMPAHVARGLYETAIDSLR